MTSPDPHITATAPGKLILLGEYAVLEGAPALVAAINRFARVALAPSNRDHYSVSAPTLDIADLPFQLEGDKVRFSGPAPAETIAKLRFFSTALAVGLQTLSRPLPVPAHFTLDTKEFFLEETQTKLGFGSSAALTVALLGALYGYGDIPLPDKSIFLQEALRAHHLAQGKVGSGVDVAASTFGGVLQYQIAPHTAVAPLVEEITLPRDLLMLVIWSGKPASTTGLVGKVRQYRRDKPGDYQRIMEKMHQTAFAGCHALMNEELTQFLELVNVYGDLLADLGRGSGAPIMSPEHQKIRQLLRDEGVVYKPSGAGGGDVGVAFSDSLDRLKKGAERLEAAGFSIAQVGISPHGIYLNHEKDV